MSAKLALLPKDLSIRNCTSSKPFIQLQS